MMVSSHALNSLAFLFFLIGLALHALAQIDAIARAKNNPVDSRLHLLTARWIPIVVRGAICTALFALWLQGELADTLAATGVSLPGALTKILDLHVGSAVALVAGFGFDSLLGYIPFLKSSGIPPSIDQLSSALASAADSSQKTVEYIDRAQASVPPDPKYLSK